MHCSKIPFHSGLSVFLHMRLWLWGSVHRQTTSYEVCLLVGAIFNNNFRHGEQNPCSRDQIDVFLLIIIIWEDGKREHRHVCFRSLENISFVLLEYEFILISLNVFYRNEPLKPCAALHQARNNVETILKYQFSEPSPLATNAMCQHFAFNKIWIDCGALDEGSCLQ